MCHLRSDVAYAFNMPIVHLHFCSGVVCVRVCDECRQEYLQNGHTAAYITYCCTLRTQESGSAGYWPSFIDPLDATATPSTALLAASVTPRRAAASPRSLVARHATRSDPQTMAAASCGPTESARGNGGRCTNCLPRSERGWPRGRLTGQAGGCAGREAGALDAAPVHAGLAPGRNPFPIAPLACGGSLAAPLAMLRLAMLRLASVLSVGIVRPWRLCCSCCQGGCLPRGGTASNRRDAAARCCGSRCRCRRF